jgi:hypothetical protein
MRVIATVPNINIYQNLAAGLSKPFTSICF